MSAIVEKANLKPSAELESAGEFSSLIPPLHPNLLKVIKDELHFSTMSPVQAAAIPLFMSNKDVAVEAPTGSGKTLSFILPVLQILLKSHQNGQSLKENEVGGLILSPTRELAKQTAAGFRLFLKEEPFASLLGSHPLTLIGGDRVSQEDVADFHANGGKVIVATPGRFEEFTTLVPTLSFKNFEVLVLDEADRLLDMGFEAAINRILERLPKQRRTGLFSATQTQAVKSLARAGLRNPVRVALAVEYHGHKENGIQHIPATLENTYTIVDPLEKLVQLAATLTRSPDRKYIVYFMTCACVEFFHHLLTATDLLLTQEFRSAFPLLKVHGKTVQKSRQHAYKQFLDMKAGALLTTDLASRGLDIPNVDCVIQFDPPQDPKAFVHRIGRTARMGNSGHALVYLLSEEDTYVHFLREKRVPITQVPKLEGSDLRDGPSIFETVRQQALTDRDLMLAGQTAFLSYVRAYKNHHCSYIFRTKTLNFGLLATSFGLIRMPTMPELRGITVQDFVPLTDDPDSIPFKNPEKEQRRLGKLGDEIRKREERRKRYQDKIDRKADFFGKGRNKKKKVEGATRHVFNDDDVAEINREARLMKLLKAGKISKREFDDAVDDDEYVEPEPEASTSSSASSSSSSASASSLSSSSSSTSSSAATPNEEAGDDGSGNTQPAAQTRVPAPAKRERTEPSEGKNKNKKKKQRPTRPGFNRSIVRKK